MWNVRFRAAAISKPPFRIPPKVGRSAPDPGGGCSWVHTRRRGSSSGRLLLSILARIIGDHPFGIAVRGHDDVGVPDGIVAGLDPPGTVAIVADGTLAPEAHQIDLGVPLAVPPADRTLRIQGTVSRLERDDVERMGAVWSVALHDVAGVGDRFSPQQRPTILPGSGCAGTRSVAAVPVEG